MSANSEPSKWSYFYNHSEKLSEDRSCYTLLMHRACSVGINGEVRECESEAMDDHRNYTEVLRQVCLSKVFS